MLGLKKRCDLLIMHGFVGQILMLQKLDQFIAFQHFDVNPIGPFDCAWVSWANFDVAKAGSINRMPTLWRESENLCFSRFFVKKTLCLPLTKCCFLYTAKLLQSIGDR